MEYIKVIYIGSVYMYVGLCLIFKVCLKAAKGRHVNFIGMTGIICIILSSAAYY